MKNLYRAAIQTIADEVALEQEQASKDKESASNQLERLKKQKPENVLELAVRKVLVDFGIKSAHTPQLEKSVDYLRAYVSGPNEQCVQVPRKAGPVAPRGRSPAANAQPKSKATAKSKARSSPTRKPEVRKGKGKPQKGEGKGKGTEKTAGTTPRKGKEKGTNANASNASKSSRQKGGGEGR